MHLKTKIEEMIEVINNDTGERSFLVLKDNEWVQITQDEYNKLLEGEK